MNLYGYGDGDPINNADPFGLCTPKDDVECNKIQQAANWAAANGHTKTLNFIAAANAIIETVGESLLQPGAAGPAAAGGGLLFRFGTKLESVDDLAAGAAKAEANGFGHGVSVTTRRPTKTAATSASREAVESHLEVNRTGNTPGHHTVILPKPVTEETASLWNRLFGRSP